MAKDKQIQESKQKLVREHVRIIPKLEKAGLKREASIQKKELGEIRKK